MKETISSSFFDQAPDRRGTYSMKWDCAPEELPMWVADMDLATCPAVTEALTARAAHPAYGYTVFDADWEDAYIGWWSRRHHFKIEREWLIFSTGVISTLSSVVRKLTTPAEKVVLQTPVYSTFYNSILNNGRVPLESPLTYRDGKFEMDLADLEAKLADPQTTLFILCNPHNPTGNIWERETLVRIGELCAKYGVTVVSDEIHCDLTDPGFSYTPFASASPLCAEISVTCIAPTKTFNIAGIQTSAVVVPDPHLRHKVWRGINTDEVGEPNCFAVPAVIAAYRDGDEWLDALRAYLQENKQTVYAYVKDCLPDVRVIESHATYLLWLDCSAYTDNADDLAAAIRAQSGLWLSSGRSFGGVGRYFLRMNVACPRARLNDGLARLSASLAAIGKKRQ